ncbi:MAG: hypothetical protein HY608_01950 [Planctomycetes bacterium]|nr:hypothetical protein [Planctomycetota bacterium]
MPERKRKPYVAPALHRVPLVPEEAVLTVCKIGSSGPRTKRCDKNQGSCVNQAAGS